MKRIWINIIVGLFVLLGNTDIGWAQVGKLTTSGDWVVDANIIDVKENKTVKLVGNVTIKDKIRIYKGAKLRIENASDKDLTLTNGISGSNNYLFYVEEGATLEIVGSKGKRIIIDGGADFTWNDDPTGYKYSLTPGKNGKILTAEAIASRGTLTLDYVYIHDVDAANQGGAILITGEDSGYGKAKNGPTTITNCLFERCYAHEGSAIHITKQNNDQGTGVNKDAEACRVKIEDTVIRYCVTGNRNNPNSHNNSPGGAIRTNGNAVSNLYLTRVTMMYNRSTRTVPEDTKETVPGNIGTGSGGAVYWNAHGLDATKLYIEDCTFEKNMADGNGAGLMLETTFEFVNSTSKVHDNIAGNIGGGIVIVGYGGGADVIGHANNLIFDLTDKLSVQNNKAVNGGGIAFTFGTGMTLPSGSKITTNFVGSTIHKNTATNNGGGLYFINNTTASQNYTIGINLNYGNITENKADDGGALYVKKEIVNSSAVDSKELNIANNVAGHNGGGIYIAGGELNLAYGKISTNTASVNGGGICMENGAFSITEGQIMGNSADYGGGLYVYNNTNTTHSVTFGGGSISNNTAAAGGGICVDGRIALTTTNTDVIENKANNAGGIYLNNYATMLFKGGMIWRNLALADLNKEFAYTSLAEKTAYHQSVDNMAGVGGGVFLDNNTSLSFEVPQNGSLGLYNNRATAAADDIFANGNNTSVTLPDVSDMNLQNFEGAAGRLFWAEDYYSFYEGDNSFQHDAKYLSDGINKAQLSDPDGNLRYQFALGQKRRNHIQEVKPMEYTNYVCLVLGYEIFYVNIIKEGLKEGESAMFHIYEATMADGSTTAAIPANAKPYMSMLLTGGEVKDGKVYRTVALPGGHWGVRENDWSYTYQSVEGAAREQIREITVDDDISNNEGFLFINQEKESKSSILHDEAKAKNIMGKEQ